MVSDTRKTYLRYRQAKIQSLLLIQEILQYKVDCMVCVDLEYLLMQDIMQRKFYLYQQNRTQKYFFPLCSFQRVSFGYL